MKLIIMGHETWVTGMIGHDDKRKQQFDIRMIPQDQNSLNVKTIFVLVLQLLRLGAL
jgi:hypothetical protein